MNDRTPITDADLNAYVDGQLDAERRAEVEAHLADNPRDRARVTAWQEQAETLRALYGHVAEEPVPSRLSVHRIAIERRRSIMRTMSAMAAALLLVVAGGAGGWVGRGLLVPGAAEVTLVSEAEAAHALYAPEVVHPVEVTGENGAHLVKWLSKRLDRSLTAPDLSADGFSLVGGRLLPASGSAAALLMYERQDGARVTLYVTPGSGDETAMRFSDKGRLAAVSWQTGALDCVLVGDQPRDTLMKLAKASYASLDPSADI